MFYSVLLVDDEKMPREVLKNYIPWKELHISAVEEAEDGRQALELAKKSRPDIVISDVKMPRMNGLELASCIRELYPECQFIFLSGYTDKEYLKGAIRLKAASYVEKPIDLDEIISTLKEIIKELDSRAKPDSQLLFYRGENGDLSAPPNGKLYVYEKSVFTDLDRLIRHKKYTETMELLSSLYRNIRQCESTPPEIIRNIYCQIVFLLLSAAENRNISEVTQMGDYLLYTAAKQPMLHLLWKDLTDAVNVYFHAEENSAHDLASRVDDYLSRHYTDCSLTVQTIASDLGFVHTYLCSAYKKCTGRTINQKLTQLRMAQAKKLLSETSLKLYEIAHDVGYSDGKYFVKLFTREIGISPRHYRENLTYHEK